MDAKIPLLDVRKALFVVVVSLHEWIRDLLAAINGRNEHEQSSSRYEQSEIASAGISFFI
ncbi:hypothetical protein AC578_2320 [Pseudocercospora eumusae]|uniref:Uncharacterized protein n=1 Tax=Pseudocercospora eumusae TaxID=321146 RepID=A0A139HXM6_9PEZI|nr:hypothetical protein AC578_2320 [Pseudocercospora eumusae]KXT07206.1 hypothetical protein AC578_2320 [Pseudocercospora eumusae]